MAVSAQRKAESALAGITVIWGASFTLVKSALDDVSTVLFLAMRFTLAAAVLAIAWRGALAHEAPLAGVSPGARVSGGLTAGVCLGAAYLAQTFGLRYTTASKSAFLTALCVVLVPLLSSFVYQTAPRWREALGIGIALFGMGLLTLPAGGATWQLTEWNKGDLLTIGCALAFAGHILVVGHWVPRTGFAALSLTQIATVAVVMLAVFSWVEPIRLQWTPRLLAALLVTGLLCTALAFSVQAWAQQHTTPTRTALIFALEPVSAWLTAWLAAGEILSPRAAAGALLILAGVLAVELKPQPAGSHP